MKLTTKQIKDIETTFIKHVKRCVGGGYNWGLSRALISTSRELNMSMKEIVLIINGDGGIGNLDFRYEIKESPFRIPNLDQEMRNKTKLYFLKNPKLKESE